MHGVNILKLIQKKQMPIINNSLKKSRGIIKNMEVGGLENIILKNLNRR